MGSQGLQKRTPRNSIAEFDRGLSIIDPQERSRQNKARLTNIGEK